jgi:hypothetical protein
VLSVNSVFGLPMMTLLFNCVNVGVRWMFLTACSPQTAALLPAIVSGRSAGDSRQQPRSRGLSDERHAAISTVAAKAAIGRARFLSFFAPLPGWEPVIRPAVCMH